MKCPKCASQSRVIQTCKGFRRRGCKVCDYRFKTIEVIAPVKPLKKMQQ